MYNGDANFGVSPPSTAVAQTINPQPTFTGMAANPLTRPRTNYVLTLNGTNFQAGAIATVTEPGGCTGVSMVAGSTVFVSATQLTIVINVTAGASTNSGCNRTVTITNPDGGIVSRSGANGLDIN